MAVVLTGRYVLLPTPYEDPGRYVWFVFGEGLHLYAVVSDSKGVWILK